MKGYDGLWRSFRDKKGKKRKIDYSTYGNCPKNSMPRTR